MKVLWFSNIKIEIDISSSGTWINSMAQKLILEKDIELFNVTEDSIKNIVIIKDTNLSQWILPKKTSNRLLPSSKIIKVLQQIIDTINPQIIQIWGTENYWGLLFSRGLIKSKAPIILEIQGFKYLCAPMFFEGIKFFDFFKMISIRDIFRPEFSIFGIARSFKQWEPFEKEIIRNNVRIGVQSAWVESHIKAINKGAQIIPSYIQLREIFLNSKKWEKDTCVKFQIFTSMASLVPYKGLHILIDAMSILKESYPKVKLFVACNFSKNSLRQSGYEKFIIQKIKNKNMNENICLVGNLREEELLLQLLACNVYVMSSFIESYSLALKEALYIAVPTVSSFVGATPEHAVNDFSCLYYNPIDSINLASKIEKYFNLDFAEIISKNMANSKGLYFGSDTAYINQIEVYKKVISEQ